jgi:hypothetical protein
VFLLFRGSGAEYAGKEMDCGGSSESRVVSGSGLVTDGAGYLVFALAKNSVGRFFRWLGLPRGWRQPAARSGVPGNNFFRRLAEAGNACALSGRMRLRASKGRTC